VANSNYYLVL